MGATRCLYFSVSGTRQQVLTLTVARGSEVRSVQGSLVGRSRRLVADGGRQSAECDAIPFVRHRGRTVLCAEASALQTFSLQRVRGCGSRPGR